MEKIPPPPTNADQWRRDLEILDADPRTAGNADRPQWLVDRVLADARKAGR